MDDPNYIDISEAVRLVAFGGETETALSLDELVARDASDEYVDPGDIYAANVNAARNLDKAKREITRAIRMRKIAVFGYREIGSGELEDKRSPIPPDRWRRSLIDWDQDTVTLERSGISIAGEFAGEESQDYEGVALFRQEFEGLFRKSLPKSSSKQPKSSPGRKPEYDVEEFLRICAWYAHLNYLPDKQSELIKRVGTLLEVIWDGKVPKDTWLKSEVSKLYAIKERFETARQEVEGRE